MTIDGFYFDIGSQVVQAGLETCHVAEGGSDPNLLPLSSESWNCCYEPPCTAVWLLFNWVCVEGSATSSSVSHWWDMFCSVEIPTPSVDRVVLTNPGNSFGLSMCSEWRNSGHSHSWLSGASMTLQDALGLTGEISDGVTQSVASCRVTKPSPPPQHTQLPESGCLPIKQRVWRKHMKPKACQVTITLP